MACAAVWVVGMLTTGLIPGLRGRGMRALTTTSFLRLETSVAPTEDWGIRPRGTRLGRDGASFAVVNCVDPIGVGRPRLMTTSFGLSATLVGFKSIVFWDRDRSLHVNREKVADVLNIVRVSPGSVASAGLVNERRTSVLTMAETTDPTGPGGYMCDIRASLETRDPSLLDIGRTVGDSLRTGVLLALDPVNRFVDMLQTTIGFEADLGIV